MNSHCDDRPQNDKLQIRPYEFFILALCVYSIVALAIQTFFLLTASEVFALDAIDDLICGFFLLDVFVRLFQPTERSRHIGWTWIDLLSNIPLAWGFSATHVMRIARITRAFRGIRLARILSQCLQRHRANGTFIAVILFSGLVMFLSSVAILQVEQIEGANIKTPSDAIWWSIVTMTTVGYGDKYPVTDAGRVIAGMLMISGVGLFGTLSGSITSWILNPAEERQQVDLETIQAEIAALREKINVARITVIDCDPTLIELFRNWSRLTEVDRETVKNLLSPNRTCDD